MDTDLVRRIQKVVGVAADGEIGNITLSAIAAKLGLVTPNRLIEIALKEVGVFETSQNHGEGIAKYWTACDYSEGYADRAPYCAAFVSWCIRQAGLFSDEKRPRTAAAFGFENWARETGLALQKPAQNVKRGDIVIFSISHVGIALSDSDAHGAFLTVEANTSPGTAGSQRDGGGVWQRTRNLSLVRSTVRLCG